MMSDRITIAVLALSAAGALFALIRWLAGPKIPDTDYEP